MGFSGNRRKSIGDKYKKIHVFTDKIETLDENSLRV